MGELGGLTGAGLYIGNEIKGEQPKTLTPAQRNDLVMADSEKDIEKSGRTKDNFCPPGTRMEVIQFLELLRETLDVKLLVVMLI